MPWRRIVNRREFLRNSLIAAGYAYMGGSYASAVSMDDSAVRAVKVRVSSSTEILEPPRRKETRIWVPLPTSDYEQEITGISVESETGYRITNDSMGNRMLYFESDSLKEGDRITLNYDLRRKAAGIIEYAEEDPGNYLKPSEWERWDKNITGYVDNLLGSEEDPVRSGRKIYYALIDMLEYIHKVCGRGVSSITFEERIGRCDEYHALFRSMMIYRGIPVKWEQGMALPSPSRIEKSGEFEADCINARSWVRFYIGNNRWFPVDLAEGKRRPDLRDHYFGNLIPDRIKMSAGRGLTLNPPQKHIINTFPYPYLEAGGLPAIYGYNYRNIMKYELLNIEA